MEDEIQIKEEPIDNYGLRKKKNQTQVLENLNHIKTESYGPVFEDSQTQRIVCLIKTELVGNTFKEEVAVANAETESDRIILIDSKIGEIIIGNNANESLHQQKTTDSLGIQRFARYNCHLCSYGSGKLANFELHKTIHTPFGCHHCKYRAASKADIKVHLRIHARKKTYKCASCDYRTSSVSCLGKHELYHGREKQFVCKLCNYRTSLRLKLKQHVLLKHETVRI